MEEALKAKLATNIANLPKMLSAHFIFWIGMLWTAYTALPLVDAAGGLSQTTVLEAVRPLFAWVPPPILALATTVIGLYLRVKPQKNLTPEVAAAKSTDAPILPLEP
jgi:hypothetical protein